MRASVPGIQSSDQGMSRHSISAAIPREAMVHMAKVITDMKAAKGVHSPGCCTRHTRYVRNRLSATSQVAATTNVNPT
jgi:hypothetical protein